MLLPLATGAVAAGNGDGAEEAAAAPAAKLIARAAELPSAAGILPDGPA